MNKIAVLTLLAALMAVAPSKAVAEDASDPLEGLKCFIMPKRDVKGKQEIEYKGATLYLCCKACVKRMDRTPEKYEAKANHQLLQTGQYVQKACPLDGSDVTDSSPVLEIQGAKVKFSSEEHKSTIAALELDEQIEKVFGVDGFKKGKFELKKSES